jgi:hypothetical protein
MIQSDGFDESNPYHRIENKDTGKNRERIIKTIVDASRLDLSSPALDNSHTDLMNQTPTIRLRIRYKIQAGTGKKP